MAISYSLEMATESPLQLVGREIYDVAIDTGLLDESDAAEQITDEDGVLLGWGTWIRLAEAGPRAFNPVLTDFGFDPAMSLVFRFDKEADIAEQQDDMIRLVAGLLERVPGDMVLHREFEEVWLLRRGDDLSVGEEDFMWPEKRLDMVPGPYRRATHAFADE